MILNFFHTLFSLFLFRAKLIENLNYFTQFELRLDDLENSPELAREMLLHIEKEREQRRRNEEIMENLNNEIEVAGYTEEEKKKYLETVSKFFSLL